jgi:hypothetical protein
VVFPDVKFVELGDVLSGVGLLAGHEDDALGARVYDTEDRIVSGAGSDERSDEVHGDCVPARFRDVVGFEETVRKSARNLVALARVASADVGDDISMEARPVVIASDAFGCPFPVVVD